MLLRLQYEIVIQYYTGKEMQLVNALARLPSKTFAKDKELNLRLESRPYPILQRLHPEGQEIDQ